MAAAALSTPPKQWAVYTQVTQIHPYQTNLPCLLANQSCKTFPNATLFLPQGDDVRRMSLWHSTTSPTVQGGCLSKQHRHPSLQAAQLVHHHPIEAAPGGYTSEAVGCCLSGTPPPTVQGTCLPGINLLKLLSRCITIPSATRSCTKRVHL